MMAKNRFSQFAVLSVMVVAGACLLAGCGGDYDGATRSAVSGKVTLDGAPLPSGSILFIAPGDASGLRMASGIIENGSYSIVEGQGPNHGTYQVQIQGYMQAPVGVDTEQEVDDPDPPGGGDEDSQDSGPQVVPAKYNTATELEVTIVAGPNTHDFPLKSE